MELLNPHWLCWPLCPENIAGFINQLEDASVIMVRGPSRQVIDPVAWERVLSVKRSHGIADGGAKDRTFDSGL
jgi:hypothetical protein